MNAYTARKDDSRFLEETGALHSGIVTPIGTHLFLCDSRHIEWTRVRFIARKLIYPMNYKYHCPHCEHSFSVSMGVFGRAKCPGCSCRVLVSDIESETRELSTKFNVCTVRNGGRRYATKAVHLNQDSASATMGSSKTLGDSVYLFCWLIKVDREIVVKVGGEQIGKMPASKSVSLLSTSEYSSSPFKNTPCALRCPARLTVAKGGKRLLEISVLEEPPPLPPRSLELTAIDNELANVRGSFDSGAFTKTTLRQCIDFFSEGEDEAEDIRVAARHDPAGPIYWRGYRHFDFCSSPNWFSDDSRYVACLKFDHRYLDVRSIEERPKNVFELVWISGAPKEANRIVEGKLPYFWKELGRTASMTLGNGKHVPSQWSGDRFCHFWTQLKGTEYQNENGASRVDSLESVRAGDALKAKLETNNPADPNAISVSRSDNVKIGYLPRNLSAWLCSQKVMIEVIACNHDEFTPELLIAIGHSTSNKSELRTYANQAFRTALDPEW